MNTGLTYAESGVDIEAGDALVERIKPAAAATVRPGTMSGLGGFGALFDLKAAGYDDPVLVAATDGVGTKLKLAIDTGNHDGVGQDLVAMCVNDLVCQGAEPLFFLDYFATGALDPDAAARVVEGIARACKAAGCALIGGETAEMPGMYAAGDYDLAGFAVGAVERGALLPMQTRPGDAILGLPSSGVHSNGFSLVRRMMDRAGLAWSDAAPFADGTLGEALLTPTALYVGAVLDARATGTLRAAAHVTGGGLTENLPRVLSDGCAAVLDLDAWERPGVFRWIAQEGGVAAPEMLRTFNCGIGMCLVVAADAAETVAQAAPGAVRIGTVTEGQGVEYTGTLV